MAITYAGCCHPIPGDSIVGIVTTGKGVTIHSRGCQMLESFSATPDRFIDVDWDPETKDGGTQYTGRISVIGANEPGTLAGVTNAVSKHDSSVNNLKVVNRKAEFCEMLLDVDVRDLRHLSTVIAGLRAVRGVTQVERARA